MAKIDEKEFEKIIKNGQRIRSAIHNLFTGKAFFTPIKIGKHKTYDLLVKIQNNNIKQMGALFQ